MRSDDMLWTGCLLQGWCVIDPTCRFINYAGASRFKACMLYETCPDLSHYNGVGWWSAMRYSPALHPPTRASSVASADMTAATATSQTTTNKFFPEQTTAPPITVPTSGAHANTLPSSAFSSRNAVGPASTVALDLPTATTATTQTTSSKMTTSVHPDITCKDSLVHGTTWRDAEDARFDCGWYGLGNHCALHGSSRASTWGGYTASDACCVCGGGWHGRDTVISLLYTGFNDNKVLLLQNEVHAQLSAGFAKFFGDTLQLQQIDLDLQPVTNQASKFQLMTYVLLRTHGEGNSLNNADIDAALMEGVRNKGLGVALCTVDAYHCTTHYARQASLVSCPPTGEFEPVATQSSAPEAEAGCESFLSQREVWAEIKARSHVATEQSGSVSSSTSGTDADDKTTDGDTEMVERNDRTTHQSEQSGKKGSAWRWKLALSVAAGVLVLVLVLFGVTTRKSNRKRKRVMHGQELTDFYGRGRDDIGTGAVMLTGPDPVPDGEHMLTSDGSLDFSEGARGAETSEGHYLSIGE